MNGTQCKETKGMDEKEIKGMDEKELEKLTDYITEKESNLEHPVLLDNETAVALTILNTMKGLSAERATTILWFCEKTVPYLARL